MNGHVNTIGGTKASQAHMRKVPADAELRAGQFASIRASSKWAPERIGKVGRSGTSEIPDGVLTAWSGRDLRPYWSRTRCLIMVGERRRVPCR